MAYYAIMSDVKVRQLPDWVVSAFRVRASTAGRSLEEELRISLTEAAARPKRESALEMAAFRKMLHRKYGKLTDSTPGIRAERRSGG